jgi:hypothetical protein
MGCFSPTFVGIGGLLELFNKHFLESWIYGNDFTHGFPSTFKGTIFSGIFTMDL